jgi:putative hydroxymethylpyrimidine transport system permease protein
MRALVTAAGLVLLWWAVTALTSVPAYMLPGPWAVARALVEQRGVLAAATITTATEIGVGLVLGVALGAISGLGIVFSPVLQRWLLPLLLLSQAIPVFAMAPVLVLWCGFGMASKIVMAVLVIFFPITAAFADGLRRTDQGWLDLAATMNASPLTILRHVRLPAALPAFGSGLRIAAAIAPIGAIIGEWVGSAGGLGYVMLNANARIETDVMFAAVIVLAVLTIGLWVGVDWGLKKLLVWAPETTVS